MLEAKVAIGWEGEVAAIRALRSCQCRSLASEPLIGMAYLEEPLNVPVLVKSHDSPVIA